MDNRIELTKLADVGELAAQFGLEGAVLVDYSVGWDGCAYLLFSAGPPERIIGPGGASFVNTKANSRYTAVVLTIDWETPSVLHADGYDLGVLTFHYQMLRPVGQDFLLLGARCHYGEPEPEKNALLIGRDGRKQKRLCLGDGIQTCITTEDRIITSYFDEGIFGNYGWDEPLGSDGVLVWDRDGEILWRNKSADICDCYAMSMDEQGNLYYYYYMDFNLVKTNFVEQTEFEVEISGCYGFAVSQKQDRFLFTGGYRKQDQFYLFDRRDDRLTHKTKAELRLGGKPLGRINSYSMLRTKLLFLTEACLCGWYFR